MQRQEPINERHRLIFLDAVRGIAALSVVLYHLFGGHPPVMAFFLHSFDPGVFGVALFFLVSGFIIPVSMQRHSTAGLFWKSRFFRLFPLYWFSLSIALLLISFHLNPVPPTLISHSVLTIMTNFAMIAVFFNLSPAQGVYWTLSVELIFYGICTVARPLKLLDRKVLLTCILTGLYIAMLSLMVLLKVSASHLQAYWAGLILTALLGSVVYAVYEGREHARVLFALVPAVMMTLFAGLFLRAVNSSAAAEILKGVPELRSYAISWIGAVIVFMVAYSFRKANYPQLVLWLGRVSYSLYLTHSLLFFVVSRFIGNGAISALVQIALALLSAELVYRFIERPFLRLAGRFRGPERQAVAASA